MSNGLRGLLWFVGAIVIAVGMGIFGINDTAVTAFWGFLIIAHIYWKEEE